MFHKQALLALQTEGTAASANGLSIAKWKIKQTGKQNSCEGHRSSCKLKGDRAWKVRRHLWVAYPQYSLDSFKVQDTLVRLDTWCFSLDRLLFWHGTSASANISVLPRCQQPMLCQVSWKTHVSTLVWNSYSQKTNLEPCWFSASCLICF